MDATVEAGRFEILRRLGSGGMGVVYEALDREQGVRVALKRLHRTDASSLLQLKSEFRSLRDLQHPNLVSLGELIESDGEWFFTMELVEGTDFLGYVCPREQALAAEQETTLNPGSSELEATLGVDEEAREEVLSRVSPDSAGVALFDEQKLRGALAQLAEGMIALHGAGKVHRDIKPANLLVDHSGRVVISDFGLVTEVAMGLGKLGAHVLAGTPAYMPPEASSASALHPAGDWFSVGVVLYRALSGKIPWRGTVAKVQMLKHTHAVLRPSERVAGVPPDLDHLCMALLQPNPAERPTGEQVLEWLAAGGDRRRGRRSLRAAETFIGRERELQQLHARFEEAKSGKQLTVLVQGESGVGKSALIQSFVRSLQRRPDVLVLRARCHERESVPYKAVDGIIDELTHALRSLEPAQLQAVLPADAGQLTQLFPVLQQLPAIAQRPKESPAGVDAKEQRTTLFRVLKTLLGRLAAVKSLVLVIDDVQWADADSLSLLHEVLAPSAPALLLLGTVRASPVEEWWPEDRHALGARVEHQLLAPLPEEDARTLARQLAKELSLEDAESIEKIALGSAGHPLFIQELLLQARTRGGAPGEVANLDGALHARISVLSAECKSLLTLASLETGESNELLRMASTLEGELYARAVATLESERLVRTHGRRRTDRVEPYHDRIRETVLAHLSGDERSQAHERLALALETAQTLNPERLATHWAGARKPERALNYAKQAAAQADAAFAFERAVALHRQVVALLQAADQAEEYAALLNLAHATAKAGRGAEAGELYRQCSELVEGNASLELKRLAAAKLINTGRFEEGTELLSECLKHLGMKLPASRAAAMGSLLWERLRLALRGQAFEVKPASEISEHHRLQSMVLETTTASLGLVDTLTSASFAARQLRHALDIGDAPRIAHGLSAEYAMLSGLESGVKPKVRRLLERAQQLAVTLQDNRLLGLCRHAEGMPLCLRGHFREALTLLQDAERLYLSTTGHVDEITATRQFINSTLWYLGRWQELVASLEIQRRDAIGREDFAFVSHLVTGVQSSAWLYRDQADEAERQLTAHIGRWPSRHFLAAHYHQMVARTNLELYRGEPERGLAWLEERWQRASRSFIVRVPLVAFTLQWSRAKLLLGAAQKAADAERERLLRAAEKTAKKLGRVGVPFAGAGSALVLAQVLELRGDTERAVQRYREAQAGFEREGLPLFAAAAQWRLGGLLPGADGEALVRQARGTFEQTRAVVPEKMVRLFVMPPEAG